MSDESDDIRADLNTLLNEQMTLRAYYYASNGRFGMVGDEDCWLPSAPLDVEQRLYTTLGELEFDGWDGDPSQPLEQLIGELREIAAKAPKKAEVLAKVAGSYSEDDKSATIELGYWRDPTKKERADREETNRKVRARDERRAAAKAEEERAEFERLKAKFGE